MKKFFKSIFNPISKKSASVNTETFIPLTDINSQLLSLLGNDFRFGTQSKDFLLKAYGMNPYLFMVVDRICQRMVEIEKILINQRGEEINDPAFLEFINQPNPKENFNELTYRATATYLSSGECFLIRKQQLGEQDQYFVPVNYNVIINEDIDGNVITYFITMFGRSETYLPNEVLHLRKPDITLDTNRGFATPRATRQVWESNNEVWESEAALHKNKGISGVLYSDGNRPMTPTEQDELQRDYDLKYTGTDKFGKVKVSTAKLGFVQMGMNPNDLKSIETRIEHLRTICASYNVDSKLFGDSQSSTYNNMAEAKKSFIIDAVIPLSKIILPEIVSFMSKSFFKEYSMKLNKDEIHELQIVMEQKSARVGREVIQGILSPEKAREILYPEMVEDIEEGEVTTIRENISIDEIIRLQESISNEIITRENAAAILEALYGLTSETANQILG